ncbi:MAG: glycosyltransferase family 2 protein [Phycisphaerales bacterium JB063]
MTTITPPATKKANPVDTPVSAVIDVVIVNYCTGELVCDCLDSLVGEADRLPGMRVTITDNASGDDSIGRIAEHINTRGYAGWATTMPLDENGGFAYGNNAAIRAALGCETPPEAVLLLNPDTVVRPGAVEQLWSFLQAHPDVGIAGSRLEHPDASVQTSAFRFPGFAGEVEEAVRFGPATRLLSRWVVAPTPPSQAQPCDWVSGASMMVRRAVFDEVGLLDDGFFMYYEELDFIRRAADRGWPCWYVPESRVVHLVGQASGVTDLKKPQKRRPAYWFEARSRYFRRHHGVVGKLCIDLGWVAGRVFFKLMNALRRKPTNDPPKLVHDYIRHNLLPGRTADA